MSRYYSPERGFKILIILWIQNFIVLNFCFKIISGNNHGSLIYLDFGNSLFSKWLANNRNNELPNSMFD